MNVLLRSSLLLALVSFLGSCESSGYSTTYVGTSYYRSSGWYDPYYANRCCYTVVRPPVHRPPNHRPPNRPDRPVTLPSRPRPPGAGGRPRPVPRR
jgi:hypothetical protein